MEFKMIKPPYKYNEQRSYKRLLNLHIALLIVSFFALVLKAFYFESASEEEFKLSFDILRSFDSFLLLIVGVLTSVIVEIFYSLNEGTVEKFYQYKSYVDPINTGLLIALLLPSNTPIYVLALAVIIGVYIGKIVFGGYGYYIFNPVLVGVLFAQISFSTNTLVSGTPLLVLKDVLSGATTETFNLTRLLLGHYTAIAIGSTSAILLLLVFIYLCVTKVIDLRSTLSFLLTIILISLGVGYITLGQGALNFSLINLVTGLTLFGAVFLVGEAVTSPTTRETKIIYGVVIGVMTMLVRLLGDAAEGVVFAVLLGNLLTPFMNRTVTRSNKKRLIKTVTYSLLIVIIITISIGFILQGRLQESYEAMAFIGGIL
ncbi:MAG: RnfABCDGE type electron transport complex subunit D [Candidatus Izimaplasma sp.]|nr:RnfABCDGE type electron transport complex subunit D [Candidatus Izimaplasma bacterium]